MTVDALKLTVLELGELVAFAERVCSAKPTHTGDITLQFSSHVDSFRVRPKDEAKALTLVPEAAIIRP